MVVVTKEFNRAIANVSRAVSKDKYRPTFCNLHLFSRGNDLILEACDGFRLHQSVFYCAAGGESIDVLVPKLDKITDKIDAVSIELKDGKLRVYNNFYDVITTEKFIDSEQVIPKYQDNFKICVNAKYLYSALKDILSAYDINEGNHMVELSFDTSIKDGGINPLSPILIKSSNQTNIVLPIRPRS